MVLTIAVVKVVMEMTIPRYVASLQLFNLRKDAQNGDNNEKNASKPPNTPVLIEIAIISLCG